MIYDFSEEPLRKERMGHRTADWTDQVTKGVQDLCVSLYQQIIDLSLGWRKLLCLSISLVELCLEQLTTRGTRKWILRFCLFAHEWEYIEKLFNRGWGVISSGTTKNWLIILRWLPDKIPMNKKKLCIIEFQDTFWKVRTWTEVVVILVVNCIRFCQFLNVVLDSAVGTKCELFQNS